MPKPPRILLLAVLLISAAALLSAVGGVALSVIGRNWFILGFEACVLAASFFGVLTGLGRFREGPALSTLTTGAVILVGAILGEPTIIARLIQGGGAGGVPLAGVNLVPWALGRLLAGAALVAIAALIVLARRPGRSFVHLAWSAVLGAPVIAAMAAIALPATRSIILNAPAPAQIAMVIGGFLILATLVSLSGHHLIRAFEVGIETARSSPPMRPVSPVVAAIAPNPQRPAQTPDAAGKARAPHS